MEGPDIGSIWNGQGFQIIVIDKDSDENKHSDGSYIKSSNGIIYKYLSGPKNKIGQCKTIKGFYACWK